MTWPLFCHNYNILGACDAFRQSIIATNPFGYWPCDDTSTGTVVAAVGDDMVSSATIGVGFPSLFGANACAGVTGFSSHASGLLELVADPDYSGLKYGYTVFLEYSAAMSILSLEYDNGDGLATGLAATQQLVMRAGSIEFKYMAEDYSPTQLFIAGFINDVVPYVLTVNVEAAGVRVYKNLIEIGYEPFLVGKAPIAYFAAGRGFWNMSGGGANQFQDIAIKLPAFTAADIAGMKSGYDRNLI